MRLGLGAVLAAAVLAGCARDAGAPRPTAQALRDAIAVSLSRAEVAIARDDAPVDWNGGPSPIETLYLERGFDPIWVGPDGFAARGQLLLDRLARADREALDPAAYGIETVRAAAGTGNAGGLAVAEILLSRALLRYAADMHGGEPRDAAPLVAISAAADPNAWLDGLAPDDPGYRRLRDALARYREIDAAGGWPVVPAGPALKPGDIDPRVVPLRRRLAATGDLAAGALDDPTYDDALAGAVSRFQARHGLDRDGRAGSRTLAAMNRPARYRVDQIAESLTTLRGPGFRSGGDGVVVNIAAAEIALVEDGAVVLRSRAIVGRPDWPTPTLRSRITAIDLNPPWYVPTRIALEEVVPKIRARGETYLQRNGLRLFDWRDRELDAATVDWAALDGGTLPFVLRQDPGPLNPLGRVKFVFANVFDVYLHDTPHRSLFVRTDRALSHGCIRVEAAERLALHLLAREGWSAGRFRAALEQVASHRIALRRPVPVYLVSLSAWVDADGTVQFREDPYAVSEPTGVAAAGKVCPAGTQANCNFRIAF